MSAESLATEPVVFLLRAGRGKVVLHAGGFRHPGLFGRERFTAYADLTHVATASRSIRIGSTRDVTAIPRSFFRDPADADVLVRTLLDRVAREPDGNLILARMAEIEETLRIPWTPWVSRSIALACVAAFALEVAIGPLVHHAGFFNAALALHGEPWRLLTANLLHADPLHLALNTIGLLALGSLVERSLGAARTALVAGLAALGATVAGLAMGYEQLVGSSGIVTGFFGALIWLELRHPERLPVGWRVPRRLLWAVLVLQGLLDLALPFIAGAAHLGGFLAGGLAAALSSGPGLRRERLAPALSLATGLVLLFAAASLLSAARLAFDGRAIESHAERLLALDHPSAQLLNDAAWLIATGRRSSDAALGHADELAERAVRETDRLDPNLLDTLAEVQFQRGRADDAVDTIEEAIALAPGVPYFEEQRRRFRGERAADDRPDPPLPFFEPTPPREEAPSPFEDDESPGISI